MDALISPRRRTLLLGALGTAALAACQRSGEPGGNATSPPDRRDDGFDLQRQARPRRPTGGAPAGRPCASALQAVDERMSLYRPESELNAFNAGRRRRAGSDVGGILRRAGRRLRTSAAGRTVRSTSPLRRRSKTWGFGVNKQRRVPAAEQVARSGRRSTGARWTSMPSNRTASKGLQGLQVDLGGIAKGYGVDVVAGVAGCARSRALHDRSRRRGAHEGRERCRRALADRNRGARCDAAARPPHRPAVGTGDGDLRRLPHLLRAGGRRYSHEIDPTTAAPIAHRLCSVTVVADDCMRADGLATALIVLGPERGFELAETRAAWRRSSSSARLPAATATA